jgi:putative transposase
MRFHRKGNRLESYDYNLSGEYFVTICTKNFVNYFGVVFNEKIKLSRMGQITDQCWSNIPKHFKMVELDKHVVMPNHVHGIIRITGPVGTRYILSLQNR